MQVVARSARTRLWTEWEGHLRVQAAVWRDSTGQCTQPRNGTISRGVLQSTVGLLLWVSAVDLATTFPTSSLGVATDSPAD